MKERQQTGNQPPTKRSATPKPLEEGPLTVDKNDPLIDKVIHDNKYKVLGKIGGGGMANIYVALDLRTNEKVAVKIVSDTADKKFMISDRFFTEAKAAVSIDHPHVVQVFDIGSFGNKLFLVMELLHGEDLNARLERKKKLSWEEARDIMIPVLDALDAAHKKNVLHRDMKPGNIFLAREGDDEIVKLIDFGLSKFGNLDDNITRDGILLGTPSYMAPEQARAINGKKYDCRVDIYAAGIILYEMLTGRKPYESNSDVEREKIIEILLMHREAVPKKPSQLNPEIPYKAEEVIMKAIEKDPDKRFATAAEMRDALDKIEEIEELEPEALEPQKDDASKRLDKVLLELPLEPDPEKKRSFAGRFFRTVALGGLIAAAGAGYIYRDRIKHAYDELFNARQQETSIGDRPVSAPSQQVDATFEARLVSEPSGASVYDMTHGREEFIGGTPLTARLNNGVHTLSVRKRGFRTRSVEISPVHPMEAIILTRNQQRAPRPADSSTEEGGSDEAPPQE